MSAEPLKQLEIAPSNQFQKLFGKLINGGVAGITGVSIIYPIDMAKTRLQNQSPLPNGKLPYNGLRLCSFLSNIPRIHCVKSIISKEGVKGLYRGLIPNLVGITPEKAIKLAVNDAMRGYFAAKEKKPIEKISAFSGMISGAVAGFCQVIATNPMEVVKIQLQTATQSTNTPSNNQKPTSALNVVKTLGIRGLYRGTCATLLRDVPFSIIFFPLTSYTTNKLHHIFHGSMSTQKPQFDAIFSGGLISGVVAAVIVTPADVIKTRLQAGLLGNQNSKKVGFLEMGRAIVASDGIKGLFKGYIPRAMTTAPLFGIAIMTYELQQRYFPI
ncbi:hypothetical protein BB561_006875 [Smittium simulii]|uniref:Mitochondrial carrier protein n=1 Tax=Smittium simulii TaxID=133385 RepID=A0A2T9Y0L2_9FUNG|nr:hypothetical protein BB561_006875 [Smittium simulii]